MKKVNTNYINSGYVIAGGTMLGMGLGMLLGNIKAYMFIGIGVGLVLAAIGQFIYQKNEE